MSVCWTIVLIIFGCCFLHIECFILIIFNRSIEFHLMGLKRSHKIIKGKSDRSLESSIEATRSNYEVKLCNIFFYNSLISNFLATWSNLANNCHCSRQEISNWFSISHHQGFKVLLKWLRSSHNDLWITLKVLLQNGPSLLWCGCCCDPWKVAFMNCLRD